MAIYRLAIDPSQVTGTHASGFVHLVTEASIPASHPIWGVAVNGGGDLRFWSNALGTNSLPLEVISFDTIAKTCILWARHTEQVDDVVGGELWIEATGSGAQPPVTDPTGRNAVWQDYELVIHQGGTTDSTGNHSPSLVGSPSLSSMLWGGQGYVFDADGLGITVPHASSLNIERNYRVSVWSNTSDAGSETQTILMKDRSNATGIRLFKEAGGETRHRNPNQSIGNLNTAKSNGLVRDTFSFDSTTRRTYVDGVVTGSDAPTGTTVNNTDPVSIAAYDDGTPIVETINGTLGEVWLSINQNHTTSLESTEVSNQSDPASFAQLEEPASTAELSISATAKKPTVVASLGASLPQPIALINTTVKKPLASSVFDATLPQPSADVVVTTKKPTVLASLSATIPGFNTSISVTAKKPTVNVDAAATLPSPQMVVAVTAKKPAVVLMAEATEPSFSLSINVTAKKPVVTLSASVTLPQPELAIMATAKKPVVLARATVSGIELEVGSDATLTYNAGNNELVYPAGSNTLKFRG